MIINEEEMKDFCILVNSCDKYSDLWDNHFKLFFDNWEGSLPRIVLLTDKKTNRIIDNVDIIVVENDSFPTRIHKACEQISEKYILVTLDDYYLIGKAKSDNFELLLEYFKDNKMQYLSIYNRRYTKAKYYTGLEVFNKIDLNATYAVNLYPAIWDKEFLYQCSDFTGSPWEFEPRLSLIAKNKEANCYYNISGVFDILDVIRKGKLLRKARKRIKKMGLALPKRKNASFRMEAKQAIADAIYWHCPKLYRLIRKMAIKLGAKSYSSTVEEG